MKKKKLIVIAGPTASGKTALSIKLAGEIGGEIVSADSMQVYRYMDIGTAKPTKEEMGGIRHHLISEIMPDEPFSVADYILLAKKYIDDIIRRGKLPIVVGGTGLYIDSLISNRQFADMDTDYRLREELSALAQQHGGDYLFNMLRGFDPKACEKIDKRNVKRVIRAIEVYKSTKKTMTEHNEHSKGEDIYDTIYFGIDMDRRLLYERINRRVDAMINSGLIQEVVGLSRMGYGKNLNSMQAIGYRQTFWYLDGLITKEELANVIKRDSRRYAKRQLTWFKKNDRIIWVDVNNTNDFDLAKYILTS